MRIFSLVSDLNHFECFVPFSEVEKRRFIQLNMNKRLAKNWKPLKVKRDRSQGPASDFPGIFALANAFSERALTLLAPLCGDSIEALPIEVGVKTKYFAINVFEIKDALDLEKSKLKLYSDGMIMRVETFAFKNDLLKGKHIFRLPETGRSSIFVSEDFKKIVEKNGLKGALFGPRGH